MQELSWSHFGKQFIFNVFTHKAKEFGGKLIILLIGRIQSNTFQNFFFEKSIEDLMV